MFHLCWYKKCFTITNLLDFNISILKIDPTSDEIIYLVDSTPMKITARGGIRILKRTDDHPQGRLRVDNGEIMPGD